MYLTRRSNRTKGAVTFFAKKTQKNCQQLLPFSLALTVNNMNRKLYRIEVEVEPMEGSQLPPDCAGAFVNVYLASTNIIDAIKAVESELLNDLYRPTNTYGAFELDLDETDYDTEEEGYPSNQELLNLQSNGGIWYGPFNLYPPEDNQLQ